MSDSSFPHAPERYSRTDEPTGQRAHANRAEDSDASRSSERPIRRKQEEGGRVVAFPRPVSQKRLLVRGAPRDDRSAEPPLKLVEASEQETEVERPAFLASELLREDWFPCDPLCRTRRWGAVIIGAVGAGAVFALGGPSFAPLVLAALLACGAALAALPLGAPVRGIGLTVLGIGGLGHASWLRLEHDPSAPLLAFGATLAASALLFRGAHRTSRLARALVGIGLVSTAGWLALTGGLDALVVERLVWQDVVDPAMRLLFGLVLIAGVLTFLDPNGRGGAWIVSAALLGCVALHVLSTLALATWPLADGPDMDARAWIGTCATPFMVLLASGGLCQVWVQISQRAHARAD